MGNSFCSDNFSRKKQIVMHKELIYETLEEKANQIVKEKEIKNDLISNRNLKHDLSLQKSINTCTPKSIDENYFINPLPDIVVLKLKKH